MHATGRRFGVLVVDDSAFMRKLIVEMVGEDARYDVIGVARDGVDAIAQVQRLDPDIVTLDIEMPKLDGLRVLEQIMRDMPRPVVVLSAGGEQFGDATLRALELGAVDFVRKPSGSISLDLPLIRDRLLDALHAASAVNLARTPLPERRAVPETERRARESARQIVVVASSTGGPGGGGGRGCGSSSRSICRASSPVRSRSASRGRAPFACVKPSTAPRSNLIACTSRRVA